MAAVGKRVLVVDDDAVILRMMQRLLRAAGWQVTAAASASQARAAFSPGSYGAVFVDVNLGAEDGIALARSLLEQEPGLRVRVMSGEQGNAGKVEEAGLGPLLLKPFSVEEALAFLADGRG